MKIVFFQEQDIEIKYERIHKFGKSFFASKLLKKIRTRKSFFTKMKWNSLSNRFYSKYSESFCFMRRKWHKRECWELNFRFMNGILFTCPWFHVLSLGWCHLGYLFLLLHTRNVRERKWCVFCIFKSKIKHGYAHLFVR